MSHLTKTKKEKWEELDFNPIRDGYWATAERIKQRIAERQLKDNSRVQYKCIKSKAEIEIYMGEKKITKLILEKWVKFVKVVTIPVIVNLAHT